MFKDNYSQFNLSDENLVKTIFSYGEPDACTIEMSSLKYSRSNWNDMGKVLENDDVSQSKDNKGQNWLIFKGKPKSTS